MIDFPPEIQSALESRLRAVGLHTLAQARQVISARYQQASLPGSCPMPVHPSQTAKGTGKSACGEPSGKFLRSEVDYLAYVAARMPATHAAAAEALGRLMRHTPGFGPGSLLDLGAGPGTASWAACALFPSIHVVGVLDRDAAWIRLGAWLARESPWAALRAARWVHAPLEALNSLAAGQTPSPDAGNASALPPPTAAMWDLVIASYSLGELPFEKLAGTVEAAWRMTGHALLVVEPGTPTGFRTVLKVREVLLRVGAQIAAPCPSHSACPRMAVTFHPLTGDAESQEITTDDSGAWCHFAVRLPRSRLHRSAKWAELGYEDEKYIYLAATRTAPSPTAARIVATPRSSSHSASLDVCTPGGLATLTIEKQQHDLYRRARKARWGDAWES